MIRDLFSCVGWVASAAIPMSVFRPRVIEDVLDDTCDCDGSGYGGNHWYDCPQHLVETCNVCSPSHGPDAGNPQPGTGHPVGVDACRSTPTGPPSNLRAEVCRAHRDDYCSTCAVDDDDLWVHPRDLEDSPAPDGSQQLGDEIRGAVGAVDTPSGGGTDRPTSELLEIAADSIEADIKNPQCYGPFVAELRARAAELQKHAYVAYAIEDTPEAAAIALRKACGLGPGDPLPDFPI